MGKSSLCYKLGIGILAGNWVWIQGPYCAGKYTNIKIFNKVFQNFLKPGERVKTNEGFGSHLNKIKFPENPANSVENWAMQGRVRECHKTLNGQLKTCGILSQVFSCHITMHSDEFRACMVMMQLTMLNGEFKVEYAE